MIVGHNGDTGLHVLDSQGQLLWKSAGIGNVWHVCAGDVLGEGKSQVVTTSAAGKVHVFGSDGKKSKFSTKRMNVSFSSSASGTYQKRRTTTTAARQRWAETLCGNLGY